MLRVLTFLAILLPALSGCATRGNTAFPNDIDLRSCMAESDSCHPEQKAIAQALRAADAAARDPAFAASLRQFLAQHALSGDHAPAWKGVDADALVPKIVAGLQSTRVTTYGGAQAYFQAKIYGTLALEGAADGPILLNRWGLPRSEASIGNSLVHEISHRVGLRHPHTGLLIKDQKDWQTAFCEPPYVIGSILEKLLDPNAWTKGGTCRFLINN